MTDIHSLSNPASVRVTTIALDLTADFDSHTLAGTAVLGITRVARGERVLVLDTRQLRIEKAEISETGEQFEDARFELGKDDPILGTPLSVQIGEGARFVRITYATNPAASGLQWLTREQTAGKRFPYVYSQSQAIHARSWIPCQDTPGVRVTYSARIHTPPEMAAVMSAANGRTGSETGDYRFELGHPIPSYLIALAIGDIHYQSVPGRSCHGVAGRSGVYAEPEVLGRAASEFEDMGRMLEACEELFGPYRWGVFDVLVLPPSFPFGGMENPMLTFATPTVLAGDKSLVSLVAHELAHSWSGNLVTNATWSDFWLNEGYTVYLERRILEHLYGKERAEMEAALGRQVLEREMAELPVGDQILQVDLAGRDPDDGATGVPYEKGYLFLLAIEQTFGRERFDRYLRAYFDKYSFQSITTEAALAYMREMLFDADPELAGKIPVEEWIHKAGIPASAPRVRSVLFERVDEAAKKWNAGATTEGMGTAEWSTQEWLRFLHEMPQGLGSAEMRRLDEAFHFTESGNDEILAEWLLMSVKTGYAAADAKLNAFLRTVGRRKFIKPIYEELAKSPAGRERALGIYAEARQGYHPIAQSSIESVLKLKR